jgi:hypothetical protein
VWQGLLALLVSPERASGGWARRCLLCVSSLELLRGLVGWICIRMQRATPVAQHDSALRYKLSVCSCCAAAPGDASRPLGRLQPVGMNVCMYAAEQAALWGPVQLLQAPPLYAGAFAVCRAAPGWQRVFTGVLGLGFCSHGLSLSGFQSDWMLCGVRWVCWCTGYIDCIASHQSCLGLP